MSAPEVYILEQLQGIVVGILAADDMFVGNQSANGQPVPIITEMVGDLITEIDIKVGQLGLCLVVDTPLFEFTNEWVSQQGAMSLDGLGTVTVSVHENVTLNQATGGTKIRAIAAAQRVLRLLHGKLTGLPDNPANPSHFMGMKRPLQKTNEGPPLTYSVLFQAHLSLYTPTI
jgi:hypothetical protein